MQTNSLTEEETAILRRIDDNCRLLRDKYMEKIEYKEWVVYHKNTCSFYGKGAITETSCGCPKALEARARNIRRPSLLDQLRDYQANKDTDRNPKAERGAPRVKVAGRPPGDMAGFFAYDELVCDIPTTVDRVLEATGRDRSWAAQSVYQILVGLKGMTALFIQTWPDQARVVDKAAARWVESARSTLRITTGDSIFGSVVCGNCGGGLGQPWGGARDGAEVRCLGTPTEGSCGETYPVGEWLRLWEDHQRKIKSGGTGS